MPMRPEDRAKMRMVHILVDKDLHKQVRLRLVEEERSIQNYVASLIEKDMARWPKRRK